MKEDEKWVSPVGALFYEFYEDVRDIEQRINQNRDALQCVLSRQGARLLNVNAPVLTLGTSQCPEPWDYADEVDTMKFLFELS
jgi:hypothetical protein